VSLEKEIERSSSIEQKKLLDRIKQFMPRFMTKDLNEWAISTTIKHTEHKNIIK
jgi:hypothetical protein